MILPSQRRRVRTMQIGFLVLLATTSAQLAWWLYDQVAYSREMQRRIEATLQADLAQAGALLRAGVPRDSLTVLFPTLDIGAVQVTLRPATTESLRLERARRLNRYAWEGGFFMLVLVASMYVVHRSLLEQAELHHRQEGFLASVSHELKSPLASLRLSAETLALRNPDPQRRLELVHRQIQDLTRLERLIGNILDTSRLSQPSLRSAPEALSLANESQHAIDEISFHASETKTAVRASIADDLMIFADRDAVRTVLRNLLHNAMRAAEGGTVTVAAAVEDGQALLRVSDDGIGFPPELGQKIFGKFYRLDDERHTGRSGTGLGLYLVRRLVELDGGTVRAHSDGPGRGAVFTVHWPLAPHEHA
ncbi:MAG TPA: HAMP domain-containing sensor histidine kinase [Gemmatimonadaceae bacterium]|jgi:signal transduction histidine kinase